MPAFLGAGFMAPCIQGSMLFIMENNKQTRISGIGDRVTSTISVTLVLFILGLVAAINITFGGVERSVKEKIGFSAVLSDSLSPQQVAHLKKLCAEAPYIKEYEYLSAADVLDSETQGEGQALLDQIGFNPYAPMIDIRVKALYANPDSLTHIMEQWRVMPEVEEVSGNTEMAANLASNAKVLNTVLLIIAATLLLISFVLINNTVRLTIYSRRFLIHTMKLVGATGAFIRRPFLWWNTLQGVVSGLLGGALLCGLVAWAKDWYPPLGDLMPWGATFVVLGGILVLGVLICVIAAMLATNRYLRSDYDEMFD